VESGGGEGTEGEEQQEQALQADDAVPDKL
jgi:hypothetical protein